MKKYGIIIGLLALYCCSSLHPMLTRAQQMRSSLFRYIPTFSRQQRPISTHQPQEQAQPLKQTQSLRTQWTALKDRLFRPSMVINRIDTAPKIFQKANLNVLPAPVILEKITSLPESRTQIQNLTQQERNTLQQTAGISDKAWFDIIQEINDKVSFIQNNCFTNPHQNITHDRDIPPQLYNTIITFLKNENINPSSLSIHYRNTIDVDPFGHKNISVFGPTLQYNTDNDALITGYEPARLVLHRQNIKILSKNEILGALQHAITHLKRAHNEQIAILQNAIGFNRFIQYAQPYKQALELEADLLGPTLNAQIAKIVQKAFLDEAFDDALAKIKFSREQHGLENRETGLTVCTIPIKQAILDLKIGKGRFTIKRSQQIETAPGIKTLHPDLKYFKDLDHYINTRKEEIYAKLATNSDGTIDNKKISDFHTFIKKHTDIIRAGFKKPIKHIIHDNQLGPFILGETTRLLSQAGINPNSINIISENPLELSTVKKLVEEQGITDTKEINYLTNYRTIFAALTVLITNTNKTEDPTFTFFLEFNQKQLSNLSHQQVIAIVSHEIGHLVKHHVVETSGLSLLHSKPHFLKRYFSADERYKTDLTTQLSLLREIEADIAYATKDQSLAKTMYASYLQNIAKQTPFLMGVPQDPLQQSSTHPSYMDRFAWINKIIELWKNEDLKQEQALSQNAKE